MSVFLSCALPAVKEPFVPTGPPEVSLKPGVPVRRSELKDGETGLTSYVYSYEEYSNDPGSLPRGDGHYYNVYLVHRTDMGGLPSVLTVERWLRLSGSRKHCLIWRLEASAVGGWIERARAEEVVEGMDNTVLEIEGAPMPAGEALGAYFRALRQALRGRNLEDGLSLIN
jgi:hypothetical protein